MRSQWAPGSSGDSSSGDNVLRVLSWRGAAACPIMSTLAADVVQHWFRCSGGGGRWCRINRHVNRLQLPGVGRPGLAALPLLVAVLPTGSAKRLGLNSMSGSML